LLIILILRVIQNILGLHAFAGCDTTSSFSGYGKKKCWKVFEEHPHLPYGIGRDCFVQDVEKFVCRLYCAPDPLAGVNQCRVDLFERGSKELEKLPQTKNSLGLHITRCNFQANVWLQVTVKFQELPLPVVTGGWKASDSLDNLENGWTTLPSIPTCCLSLSLVVAKQNANLEHVNATKANSNVHRFVSVMRKIVTIQLG
jgi:hypothetical protein